MKEELEGDPDFFAEFSVTSKGKSEQGMLEAQTQPTTAST